MHPDNSYGEQLGAAREQYLAGQSQKVAEIRAKADTTRKALVNIASIGAQARAPGQEPDPGAISALLTAKTQLAFQLQELADLTERFSNPRDDVSDRRSDFEKQIGHVAPIPSQMTEANIRLMNETSRGARPRTDLSTAQVSAIKETLGKFDTEIKSLSATLKQAARLGDSSARRVAGALDVAATSMARNDLGDALRRSATALGEAVSKGIVSGADSIDVLNDFLSKKDLLDTQIDALQDAADPVWREITAKVNEPKWNPNFSQTLFYSEGNTSVVVTRDRLGHFRVQRGRNNPAAVIQGQLKVSRAIASGLTDILGATIGVSGLSGKLPGGAQPDPSASTPMVEIAAGQDALVAAELVRREAAITNLQGNLDALIVRLEAATGTSREAELVAQLRAVLNGHKPVFAAPPPGGK